MLDWTAGFSRRADDQKLRVAPGTSVAFTWTGVHNVYLLRDRAAFGSFGSGQCDFSEAQLVGDASGAMFTFDVAPGTTLFFGCMIGSHCTMGQKLAVEVGAAPPVNCSVSWSASWTKCSPTGMQTRRYTVDVYPTRGGAACHAKSALFCPVSSRPALPHPPQSCRHLGSSAPCPLQAIICRVPQSPAPVG